MPGVLVDEQQAFPFDSPMLSPIFETVTASHSSSECEEQRQRMSSLRKFFSNGEDFVPGSAATDQGPLNLSAFHGLDIFSSPPSSPSEKMSPRSRNVDLKDEYAQRVFTRALSKLGTNNSVAMAATDLAFGDVLGTADGLLSESVDDAQAALGFSGNNLISTPASAYDHSCSGGGGLVPSLVFPDAITALQKFLPSNNEDMDSWPAVDVYSCDEFRMYEFKVRRCMRGRSHDWTECPFAHPGEKARRRDPKRFHYSGTACPDFRKGSCRRGDTCEFAHGVFECWLHPARYRTQPCKDGTNCRRRVCFFAHTPEQLRLLPGALQAAAASSSSRGSVHSSALKAASLVGGSYDGSPLRQALASSIESALALESFSGLGQNGIFDGSSDGGGVGGSSPRCGGHLGFVNKAALCCGSPQISSPTSTLVGHSFSPPPLSPPLSPSGSPPMSPNSPNSWTSALVRSLSCLSASQGSHQGLSALSQAAALSQVQASIAACSQNLGPISASTVGTHGPAAAAAPAHRRHLDRLHSVPSVSITSCLEGRDVCSQSPVSVSSDKMASSQAMNDLIVTLQQLELTACAADANRTSDLWSSNGPSLHFSQSVPATPTKVGWRGQIEQWDFADTVEPLQRVESGRDLRAKIYGRLCKENPLENDSPDLGWVNELVK